MIYPKQTGKTLTLADRTASGAITVTGAIEQYRCIAIAQSTASIALTLPSPSDATVLLTIDIANTGTALFTMNGADVTPNRVLSLSWVGSAWRPMTYVGQQDAAQAWAASTVYNANFPLTGTTPASGLVKDAAGNLLANGQLYTFYYATTQTSGAALDVAEWAKLTLATPPPGSLEFGTIRTTITAACSATVSSGLTMAQHVIQRPGNVGIIANPVTSTTGSTVKTAFGIAGKTLQIRQAGQPTVTIADTDDFPLGVFAFSYAGTTLSADRIEGSGYLTRFQLGTTTGALANLYEYRLVSSSAATYTLPTAAFGGGKLSQTIVAYNGTNSPNTFTLTTATDKLNGVTNGTFVSDVQGQYIIFFSDPVGNGWNTIVVNQPDYIRGGNIAASSTAVMLSNAYYKGTAAAAATSTPKLPTATAANQTVIFYNVNGASYTIGLQTSGDTLNGTANGTFTSATKGQRVEFISTAAGAWIVAHDSNMSTVEIGAALPPAATRALYRIDGSGSTAAGLYFSSGSNWVKLN